MSPGASTAELPLDALAARLLAAVPELRVAVAGPGEGAAIHRLRREHILAIGWARDGDPPTVEERDAHDAHALQIGAWRGDTVIGAVRLVLPAPGRLLPVEEEFGVRIAPAGAVAEAGRLVIAPAHRGDPAHRTWGALFARAWLELRARRLSVLAGAASPAMVARLRALGLPFEVLGPARGVFGEPRHPVRLDPARADPRWYTYSQPSVRTEPRQASVPSPPSRNPGPASVSSPGPPASTAERSGDRRRSLPSPP
jgi:hypothetical protein